LDESFSYHFDSSYFKQRESSSPSILLLLVTFTIVVKYVKGNILMRQGAQNVVY